MKKILGIISVITLAACNNDTGSINYPYQNRNQNPLGAPSNPSQPFYNAITNINSKITGMTSNNSDQIAAYINYRLNEWNMYNPDTGKNVSRTDIANAALWLTDGNKTKTQIEQYFSNKLTLFHMAAYVIENRLNSCFSDGSVGAAATCFTKWRDNSATFATISDEIHKYTTLINVADAELVATNDAKIKFIVSSDGQITGATITENNTTTKYDLWSHFNSDDNYTILDTMKYTSAGKDLGLSYSDFGTYSIKRYKLDKQTREESTEMILTDMPLAGGYDSHKISNSDITKNVHFTGRAIGNAQNSEHIVDLDGTATLAFDAASGTSRLGASFNNWYDINVQDDGAIEFSNYTNKNTLVKLAGTPNDKGIITDTGAKIDIGYYAPNSDADIPTESTGLVQYTETTSNTKMDIAFGAIAN